MKFTPPIKTTIVAGRRLHQWVHLWIAACYLILPACTVEFKVGGNQDSDSSDIVLDNCPSDPAKTESGVCGCGIPENLNDSDGDSVVDCLDGCIDDPNKTEPGNCGCGSPDFDADGHRTIDCNDTCPDDPTKTEPGVCGCGVPESRNDMDGDLLVDCLDGCVDDPNKIEPGICGCGVPDTDSDGDLTLDCEEECVDDPDKIEPGICGCGNSDDDRDGDGARDCNDDCVDDPEKTVPGMCGCGMPETDKDRDGTPDCNDLCVDDPEKTVPGICGCGLLETDNDGDGVLDCNDDCAEDPKKTEVGECGCGILEIDGDGDGTPDCNDKCAVDSGKIDPGVCGCGIPETDGDGDGTLDCADKCMVDPGKIEPGVCGCGISDADGDGDGTYDCNDNCVSDSNKVEPGICGCGTPDTDSDGDGTLDCIDNCDDDPNKLEPGVCGCGAPDTDSDGDGTLDCNDGCDVDSGKIEPGICGCGTPDTDSDGDSTPDCNDECPRDSSGVSSVNWYPDCDGDGIFSGFATYACGTSGADALFVCDDSAVPDGSWSLAQGSDCYDEDAVLMCDCGEQDNDGDGNCASTSSLEDAHGVVSGVMNFELSRGTLPLYVDGDYDLGGWVLIGRGREGWAWSEAGAGDPTALWETLGTPASFPPRYLSTLTVQELINNTGIDLTGVEIRIKRAAATDGSSYQETVWKSQENPSWTWLFDTDQYDVDYLVAPSVLGQGTTASSNTRDAGWPPDDDHRRTFTWDWAEHNSVRGFSYGVTVLSGSSDAENFLWQFGTEGAAIPYSEVYIRFPMPTSCLDILTGDPAAVDGAYEIDPSGSGGDDPIAVTCDMSGGGWTIIYSEDFASGDSSGWEDGAGAATPVDTKSDCATTYSEMLGGFDIMGVGAQTVQTFDLLDIPHTEIFVTLDYIVIDKWDKELAFVYVDEARQYREKFNWKDAEKNTCGKKGTDLGPQPVIIQAEHSSDSVTVQVTSNLDQDALDESFGVDNVVIRIR